MTQLNTPYPSTAYLTGFLRSRGIAASQEDLALALVLRLFTPDGLRALRARVEAIPPARRAPALVAFAEHFPRHLASIDAGSREADEESAGRLWFNRSAHPKATFAASQVVALGNNRFELRGTLTLKGRTRELVIPVTYTPGRTVSTFDGSFVLRRLDFGIGEGMWADVSTVANEVPVKFRIAASGK